MQSAEQPDQQDDRKGNADQPKQESAAHMSLLGCLPMPNAGEKRLFRPRC